MKKSLPITLILVLIAFFVWDYFSLKKLNEVHQKQKKGPALSLPREEALNSVENSQEPLQPENDMRPLLKSRVATGLVERFSININEPQKGIFRARFFVDSIRIHSKSIRWGKNIPIDPSFLPVVQEVLEFPNNIKSVLETIKTENELDSAQLKTRSWTLKDKTLFPSYLILVNNNGQKEIWNVDAISSAVRAKNKLRRH